MTGQGLVSKRETDPDRVGLHRACACSLPRPACPLRRGFRSDRLHVVLGVERLAFVVDVLHIVVLRQKHPRVSVANSITSTAVNLVLSLVPPITPARRLRGARARRQAL